MISNVLRKYGKSFWRKKTISSKESGLKRCLNTFDLTALGVGSTLGVGIYILAGQISNTESGPAVSLSFLFAAVASIFAGLCYAEFGAIVPKAGSAYIYSYVCIGEFVAFIIGWSLLASYGIGASSVAKGFSQNIDSISEDNLIRAFKNFIILQVPYMAKTVDFLAFGIIMVLTGILSFGIKESTLLNNLLTCLNVSVVIFVLIAGIYNADISNWKINEEVLKRNYSSQCLCSDENFQGNKQYCNSIESDYNVCGVGGFFPFGFEGVVKGAATAFYGFVGFDVIATVSEEVLNPKTAIPLSIVASLSTVFLAYFGISTVITLDLPYFLQDVNAPLPYLFKGIGWAWAAWVVRIGAFFGLFASLLGALMPLPRILWAMASDGLIFKQLAYVHPKTQTPIWSGLVTGIVSALMAAVFDLDVLVDLMSIGTLLAYTIVSACVMLLRYKASEADLEMLASSENKTQKHSSFWRQILNLDCIKVPNKLSSKISSYATLAFGFACICLTSVSHLKTQDIIDGNLIYIAVVVLFIIKLFLIMFILYRQPTSSSKAEGFQVPLIPFLPCLSILMNIYLMVNLKPFAWVQFIIYLIIGLTIYVFYGVKNSVVMVAMKDTSFNSISIAEKEKNCDDSKMLQSDNLDKKANVCQDVNIFKNLK